LLLTAAFDHHQSSAFTLPIKTRRIDPVQGTVHHSNDKRFPGTEISYMSNPIQDKATEWWQLISDKETADSYKSFFQLTWKILKETALLVWLLLCFVLVSVGWVWHNSSKVTESVSDLRTKVDQKSDSNMLSEAAVKFWEASQTTVSNALATARKQLNLPEQPEKAPKAAKVESAAQSPPNKTPEQYAQEQAARDAAARAEAAAKERVDKERAEAAAKAAQMQAAENAGEAANAGEATEEA
jgi:hypothetical protein